MPSIVLYMLALQLLYFTKTAKPVMQKRLDWAAIELHHCEVAESSVTSLLSD